MVIKTELTINDKRITKLMDRAVKNQRNLRPFYAAAKVIMFKDVQEHFLKEEGGEGRKWPRLSPSTAGAFVTKKNKRGFRNILRVEGTRGGLFSTLQAKHNNLNATISANKPYAAIHNFGGTIKSRKIKPKNKKALSWIGPGGKRFFSKGHTVGPAKIPKRKYMWISGKARLRIIDFLIKHVLGAK